MHGLGHRGVRHGRHGGGHVRDQVRRSGSARPGTPAGRVVAGLGEMDFVSPPLLPAFLAVMSDQQDSQGRLCHRVHGPRLPSGRSATEQETDVFKQRYSLRWGIESTNSGLKNRLELRRLRVRGRGSVFRVVQHKLAGWNVLRAAASTKLRAWVAEQVARSLKTSKSGQLGRLFPTLLGSPQHPHRVSQPFQLMSQGLGAHAAA